MEEQNIKAYLDLVQQLLGCRRGEEWIVLRQNEHLVNGKFIEVMEQVANYLATEGELNGARYLHNWAGKLHHMLTQPIPPATKPTDPEDKTQAYAKLIESLLTCRRGTEQKIFQANQSLISPQLVTIMGQVADEFSKQGDAKTATYLNNLAAEVNRKWIQTHDFQPSLTKANQLAPDPWDDNPQPAATATKSPANKKKTSVATAPKTEPPAAPPVETPPTPIVEKTEVNRDINLHDLSQQMGEIGTQMGAIAASLSRLEDILIKHLKPSNPLEYLVLLEQAAAASWIISSKDVAQLIGIHPQCAKGKSYFERGNWRFIKAGKLGVETGWRIEKVNH